MKVLLGEAYSLCHSAPKPDAFGHASILWIVEASICDLQAADRGLDRRKLVEKMRLANGLRVPQARDFRIQNIVVGDRGIDAFDVTLHLFDELTVFPFPLELRGRHVIGRIDDRGIDRPQVGKFD